MSVFVTTEPSGPEYAYSPEELRALEVVADRCAKVNRAYAEHWPRHPREVARRVRAVEDAVAVWRAAKGGQE